MNRNSKPKTDTINPVRDIKSTKTCERKRVSDISRMIYGVHHDYDWKTTRCPLRWRTRIFETSYRPVYPEVPRCLSSVPVIGRSFSSLITWRWRKTVSIMTNTGPQREKRSSIQPVNLKDEDSPLLTIHQQKVDQRWKRGTTYIFWSWNKTPYLTSSNKIFQCH